MNRKVYNEKYIGLIESFLFSDFPFVRKIFIEEFYMFLIAKGDLIYNEEELEELTEFLSNMELCEDSESWLLFKNRWESISKQKYENELN